MHRDSSSDRSKADSKKVGHGLTGWRARGHEIIFEADTPAGKLFDVLLIACIALSVVVVMLESVAPVREAAGGLLMGLEWTITALFTVEYGFRLACVRRPLGYALSFFGLVDLLAVLPSYLTLVFPGTHYLAVIRILRMLRIFRVLKLVQYLGEADLLLRALAASRRKILVFLFAVCTLVVILGSLMYVIEGAASGFDNIPEGVYWAIVTMTTVGYGDITPQTPVGKMLSALVMILGYGIIAVPTGIVTAGLVRESGAVVSTQACPSCGRDGHDPDAEYCKFCGSPMDAGRAV